MTTPKPTPEKQNSPEVPDSKEIRPTGFFNRVRQELKAEPEQPIHPSEVAEIVIMDEDADDEKTRSRKVCQGSK
jgi:hypothetical protein